MVGRTMLWPVAAFVKPSAPRVSGGDLAEFRPLPRCPVWPRFVRSIGKRGARRQGAAPDQRSRMSQSHIAGRHFLQIPGPTNVPDRVLRAIDNPTIDHRGPAFGRIGMEVLTNLRAIFQTSGPVVIYPASGTGAWEAALTNTLSPGDTVLMCRTGWFASLWKEMAERLQLVPVFIDTDWRRGADVAALGAALADDKPHRIKAVCVVHNETSTGCASRIDEVRRAMDA